MTIENLLPRLDKVKKTGPGKYQARCPVHADKNPSLVVRELDDGRVLIHCFAGCGAADILDAAGLNFGDLFPPKSINGHSVPRARKPWIASDILHALAFEVLLALNYSKQMAAGHVLTEADQARLLLCATRMQNGLGALHE